MRFWKRLFGEAPPPPPVFVRVADPSGAPAVTVDVEVTWLPSGATTARRHHTAAGLCVIPWRGDEVRVRLRIHSAGAIGVVEVERARADAHRVHELALGTAALSRLSA